MRVRKNSAVSHSRLMMATDELLLIYVCECLHTMNVHNNKNDTNPITNGKYWGRKSERGRHTIC